MAGEQSIYEADLVNEKKTECHADQAGRNSQAPIESRESLVRIGKRQNHRAGDEHHSCDGADTKHEEIRNCPLRIPNRGQDQQRDGGRAGEAVDKSDDEGPDDLIDTEPPKMAIKPTERRLLRRVRVGLRCVLVGMGMNVIAVGVRVRVSRAGYSTAGQKCVGNPLEHAGEIQDAEEDQHQSDGKFHGETDASGNHPAEKNNSAAYQENGEGVTHAPKCANHRGVANLAVARNDGGDSDDVVGICSVPHSEEETESDNGE